MQVIVESVVNTENRQTYIADRNFFIGSSFNGFSCESYANCIESILSEINIEYGGSFGFCQKQNEMLRSLTQNRCDQFQDFMKHRFELNFV